MKKISVSGLLSLKDRRVKICLDLFKKMCKPDYKSPKPHECSKSLTNAPPNGCPKFRTNHYRDTFIPYALMKFQ